VRFDGISFQDGSGSALTVGSRTLSGFQIGGGLEGALNRNWSWRFDYLYSFLNSFDAVLTSVASNATTGTVHIDPSAHAARVGVVYRFGG
jgi:outer membrane immunogenic protein